MESKNSNTNFLTFLLILALISIIVMGLFIYKIYNEKTILAEQENNLSKQVNMLESQIENLQKIINNISNTNTEENTTTLDNNTLADDSIITDNTIPTDDTTNSNTNEVKIVKYKFTSADRLAAQGNPSILEIFELTDTEMEFEYNHGWDFTKSTIVRKISAIAKINDENLYEFTENIDGHKYTITIKFSEDMVTLYEYIDGNLSSYQNLWS